MGPPNIKALSWNAAGITELKLICVTGLIEGDMAALDFIGIQEAFVTDFDMPSFRVVVSHRDDLKSKGGLLLGINHKWDIKE
jgi:hypothetical protein